MSTNSIWREHVITVDKADICIHQIIENIVEIIQRHTAAKPMQKDQKLKHNNTLLKKLSKLPIRK